MGFKDILDKLSYAVVKTAGNALAPNNPVTPERQNRLVGKLGYFDDKENSRGVLGDFLAKQLYRPPDTPIISPLQDQPIPGLTGDTYGLPRMEASPAEPLPSEGLDFGKILGAIAPRVQAAAPSPTPIAVPTPTLLPDAPENPYYDLLKQYFPDEQVNNASNVSFKESGFRPDAINVNNDGSTDYGLFQINSIHEQDLKNKGYTLQDMLDVAKNIQYAAQMQAQQGWEPWYGADALGLTSRSQ